MNQLRVLLLTTLILLPASRLLGAQGPPVYRLAPVVCNDGTLSFFVVRAYMDVGVFYGHEPWVIEGWYEVAPGKCQDIGPDQHYDSNKIFGVGTDSVSLLAFAFWDSKG